jgi:ferric-dicitrate binding protein FerR (iron transport regulator)
MSRRRQHAPIGEDALAALAGVARREARGEAPDHDRGRERALAAFQLHVGRPRRGGSSRRARSPWLVAAALAGVVALALALTFFPRASLRFTLDGATAAAGSYVPAGGTLRFDDGSVITFASDAGGRIAECGPDGARVLLESGTASFQVAHRPGARWSVEAGPFVIAVIGTAFDASWSASAQQLEVRLHQGEVSVRGPSAPNGVRLRAGQLLTARAADGELRISEAQAVLAAEPPAPVAVPLAVPLATTETAAPVPVPIPVSSTPSAAPIHAAPSWPRRVAGGDFLGVVVDAEARGADVVLRQAALADLMALADAARYASRPALARSALLAERARFAGSAEARAAAFLLGRLADDTGEPPAAAIRWYDVYLTEAPRGAFAAEALGLRLAALRRAGDPAARVAAAEYLGRYPDGPYAATAQDLLANP